MTFPVRSCSPAHLRRLLLAAAIVSGAFPSASLAQSIIGTFPDASATSASVPGLGGPALPSRSGAMAATGPAGYHVGPFALHPHFSDTLTYGDGFQASPGHQVTTAINSLAGGVLIDLGEQWSLDYTADWTTYSSRQFRDSLDHALAFSGQVAHDDLALQFSQSYASTSTPRIETGRQTFQQAVGTTLGGSYSAGRHVSLQSSFSQSLQFIDAAPDTYEWTEQSWVHYRTSDHLDLALGFSIGYVMLDPGTDMDFTQPQASVVWHPVEKLSFNAQAGLERRNFLSRHQPSMNTPTFSGGLNYQPFAQTTLALSGDRSVETSYFQSQVTRNTGWNATLDQRLFGHFHLTLGASEQKERYIGTQEILVPQDTAIDFTDSDGNPQEITVTTFTVATVPTRRDDRETTYSVRFSVTLFGRLTTAVTYQRLRNRSSAPGFSLRSEQGGLDLGYRF